MRDDNYEKIVKKVAISSGLDVSEIEKRVEAKRSKLAGLISLEGAAQVVAAELGISFENERSKINDLLPGMRKVNVVGQILNLSPVRTFTTKKGDSGKVANIVLADDTSNIKVVLWDTNHISLIENGEMNIGSIVEIMNGTMRDNEIHLGSFSEIKLSKEILENSEILMSQRRDLIGKEMIFKGNVRNNSFFNNPEFIIDSVSDVNLDELIAQLEK